MASSTAGSPSKATISELRENDWGLTGRKFRVHFLVSPLPRPQASSAYLFGTGLVALHGHDHAKDDLSIDEEKCAYGQLIDELEYVPHLSRRLRSSCQHHRRRRRCSRTATWGALKNRILALANEALTGELVGTGATSDSVPVRNEEVSVDTIDLESGQGGHIRVGRASPIASFIGHGLTCCL
ncbi:hypothetical protein OG21DRAFT_1028647 [Imleria badia]|nr:hypothetical protein OG21DRAFT_1028647 [Imleria badia]